MTPPGAQIPWQTARGPYMPGLIGQSVILTEYNVYPFAYSDGVRFTLLSPMLHSSS